MRAKLLFSLSAIAASVLLGSCKSNPVTTIPNGSINGTVTLVGNGTGPLSSSAGVTAALDGTNYSAQTDSNGFWHIDNVAPGNYDVVVSKAGFGACRVYGVTVEGPGTAHVDDGMYIGIAPTDIPTIKSVTIANGALSIEGGGAVIFFDRNPNMQPGDAHTASTYTEGLKPLPSLDSGTTTAFSIQSLHNVGLPSGSTVYISSSDADIFGYSRNYDIINQGTYYDPVHNVLRLISPGPRSNVIAITMP